MCAFEVLYNAYLEARKRKRKKAGTAQYEANVLVCTEKEDYPAGKVTKEQIKDSFRAWDAHAAHGDTYSLRLKYAAQVSELIGEEVRPRRKITAPTRRVRELRKMKYYQRLYKETHPANEKAVVSAEPRPDDVLPWE